MEALGYGGFVANAGVVTQASDDGGIDGVIKEDKLGLGHIYLQAKRYKADNKIGCEAIQAFVGSLAVANSNKGVFITTSSFSDCPLIIARFSAPPFFVRPLSDMRSIAGYVPNGGQRHGGKGPVEIGK